jgi:hypothetical protein
MAATVGGPIESVTIGNRTFPVAADADANRKIGGSENEVQSNGDGSARIVKKRTPWKVDGLSVEVNDDRNDQKYLQDIADGNDYVPITITFASGKVYQGRGTIEGEIQASSESATAEISLSGPQQLTPQ